MIVFGIYIFWNFIRILVCTVLHQQYGRWFSGQRSSVAPIEYVKLQNSSPIGGWQATGTILNWDVARTTLIVHTTTTNNNKNKTNRTVKVMRMCCSGKRMLKPLQQPAAIHRKSFKVFFFFFFFLYMAFVRIAHASLLTFVWSQSSMAQCRLRQVHKLFQSAFVCNIVKRQTFCGNKFCI